MVIGHAGDSNDLDHLEELADAGCILGVDRFGLDLYDPTSARVDTIVSTHVPQDVLPMLRERGASEGHLDQMLVQVPRR